MHPSTVSAGKTGRGIVATEDLKAGTVVEHFHGRAVSGKEITDKDKPFVVLLDDDKWMVPEGDARYINHSCLPNCRIASNLDVITMQPAAKGEELTIGYTLSHKGPRSDDQDFHFECRCGTADCMGTVGHIYLPRYDANGIKVEIHPATRRGRGVFARSRITKDELIERSPVILLPDQDWAQIEDTLLYNYVFEWGPEGEQAALALGSVSLYNHSYEPNAQLTDCLEDNVIEVVALRDIERGEEILVNYNGDIDNKEPLWFTVA